MAEYDRKLHMEFVVEDANGNEVLRRRTLAAQGYERMWRRVLFFKDGGLESIHPLVEAKFTPDLFIVRNTVNVTLAIASGSLSLKPGMHVFHTSAATMGVEVVSGQYGEVEVVGLKKV